MVERFKPPARKAQPPAARQEQSGRTDFGAHVPYKVFGGLQLTYCAKETSYGWARRYYIGRVQFGFIRYTGHIDLYTVHLTGQDDVSNGHEFETIAGAEAFLLEQLVAK